MRLSMQFAFCASVLFVGATSAQANTLLFDITYTQAVQNNPQFVNIESAVNYVSSLYSGLFSTTATLNFKIDQSTGVPLTSNDPIQQLSNFSQISTALAADGSGVYVPQTDPTGGGSGGWVMNTAEAKALGIFSGVNGASDGTMTFNPNQTYTYDPANRSVTGAYDFIGMVEHEFSEMMGRDSQLSFSQLEPYDLFRFSAPGSPSFSVTPGQDVYFSTDNGATRLATFNSTSGGDFMDLNGSVVDDPFNAFASTGQAYSLNAVDLLSFNAVGFESAIPEPSEIILVASGCILLAGRRRRAPRI